MPSLSGSGASTRGGGSGAAAPDYWAMPPRSSRAPRADQRDLGEFARRLAHANGMAHDLNAAKPRAVTGRRSLPAQDRRFASAIS